MLTEKQRLFIEHWQGSSVKAATAAGYRWPEKTGPVLLKKTEIFHAIKAKEQVLTTGGILSVADVQKWWSAVLLDDEHPIGQRVKASELLVRSLGGFLADTSNDSWSDAQERTLRDALSRFARAKAIDAEFEELEAIEAETEEPKAEIAEP